MREHRHRHARLAVLQPMRVKYQPTPSTTGSSRNTRNSLTITAVLPTGIRHRVAGADHLGDVVNGAAEHHAGGLRVEAEQDAERRIDQHGEGRERIDRDHDEGDVRLLAGIVRHHRRAGERRRGAAHRGADADQRAEARPRGRSMRAKTKPGDQRRRSSRPRSESRFAAPSAAMSARPTRKPSSATAQRSTVLHAETHAGLRRRPRRRWG